MTLTRRSKHTHQNCPPHQQQWLKTEIQRLMEQGTITKSRSHIVSPIVLVPKKDTYRLCVNYKDLNKRIHVPHTILPDQEEIRNKVARGNYINVYDIKDAYHLLPIRKEDKHKTAFATPFGTYEFTMLLFGLASAPYIFQTYLTQVLDTYPYQNTQIYAYMDDIYTIHNTETEAQHSHQQFMKFMHEQHIPIQPTKYQIAVQKTKVLGMTVDLGSHTIFPTQSYLENLQRLRLPHTEKDKRRVKGKLAYIARFLPNAAQLLSRLPHIHNEPNPRE